MTGHRDDHDDIVDLIAETASGIVALVVDAPDDVWERPALGEWNVRQLVGHLFRAFSTIDRFLDEPLHDVVAESAAQYYRLALGSRPDIHAEVAQRGRDAGVALGDDPAAAVVEGISAVLGRLADTTGDEIGTTAVGGMRLTDYLDTRLVELVVHRIDLCAALGVAAPDPGRAGVRVAATVFASATPADQVAVLAAMLGRRPLPPGFNVWP